MCTQKPFLDQVATFLHASCGTNLADTALIVPSYRVGNRLVRDLARRQGKVSWAPQVYTLKAFMKQLSPLHIPDRLVLLRSLYDVAYEMKATQERFEDFVSWGGRLLDDFGTMDHYLIEVDELFTMPTSAGDMSLLPEASKAFWKTTEGEDSALQKRWLELWRFLPALYQRYKERLLHDKMAYEGLQRRELYVSLQAGGVDIAHKRVVGVALHKFTRAEERIFACLKEKVGLDFCWDEDPYYVKTVPSHRAGYYFRQRSGDPLFKQALPTFFSSDMQARSPVVEVIGAKGVSGQVAALRETLERLVEEKGAKQVAGNTVVVAPDPTLLLPLIHALPTALGDIKISMGYPLTSTPAYALLIALLRFQVAWKEAGGLVTTTLLQALEPLCAHPYLQAKSADVKRVVTLVSGDPSKLPEVISSLGVLGVCLQPIAEGVDVFDAVKKCVHSVQAVCQGQDAIDTWEKVAMKRCIDLWMDIASVWSSEGVPATASHALVQMVGKQAQGVFLPIKNPESDRGIEVMGLSQTVGLDFAYVFVLSMNEGVIPSSSRRATFVPHLLRQAFGWPETEAREAESAYPFYRLLQCAQHVFCLYEQGGSVGERSHYLYELSYGLGWNLKERCVLPSVSLPTSQKVVIAKDEAVLERLAAFKVNKEGKAERALSPSALNMYLDCPLCFYLQYIAKIKPLEGVEGEMDPPTFGKLFHGVMEQLYTPYIGREIGVDILSRLQEKRHDAIEKAYDSHLPHVGKMRGTDLIVKRVLAMLSEQVVKLDQAYAPFTLLGLELGYGKETISTFRLSDGNKIALGGVLDRVDRKGDTIRVVDYKTGACTYRIPSLASLFERSLPLRNKTALQLLWYAWRYQKEYIKEDEVCVMPAVISTRMAWKPSHHLGFVMGGQGGSMAVPLTDMSPYTSDFEKKLREVLDELFDPTVPFEQSEEAVHSVHSICQRVCR